MNTNNLFRNYSLSTDSYDFSESSYDLTGNLIGGKVDENDKPNGGFLPIIACQKNLKNEIKDSDEDKVKREYKTHKTSLSIKDLLAKRRKTTPFISSQ